MPSTAFSSPVMSCIRPSRCFALWLTGASASLSASSPEHPTAIYRRFSVCNRGGNGQLGLRTRLEFTPHRQLTPHKFGAFVHAQQAVVPGASATGENFLVDAFSVVPHPQPKLPWVISDFHFNLRRM